MEEFATDRSTLPGSSDHRDRLRAENRLDRVCGSDLLAPLEALDRFRRERCREGDDDFADTGSDFDGNTEVAEHLDHAVVLRQHPGDEDADAVRIGDLGQLPDEDGPQPASLIVIGDGERDFNAITVELAVRRDPDDPVRRASLGDQGEVVPIIDRSVLLGRFGEVDRLAEEAELACFCREPFVELADRWLVLGSNGAHVHGASIAQDDVGFTMRWIDSLHLAAPSAPTADLDRACSGYSVPFPHGRRELDARSALIERRSEERCRAAGAMCDA
ncbi:hypothetical protein HRbin27_02059 [bacterium HR27]|nr:hypothetical protein HRbin27_02059 [bacterium HR27]